jgi:hypothetical protein
LRNTGRDEAYGWPTDLTDEQILERLVALNAERAEEEKRGLVRWLRPEFQCQDALPPAPETGDLDLPEPESESESVPTPTKRGRQAKAGDKPRWPETLPDQIAAVRDLVLGTRTAWTVEAVARSFKYARASSVQPVLESLAALGLLVSYQSEGGQAWRAR